MLLSQAEARSELYEVLRRNDLCKNVGDVLGGLDVLDDNRAGRDGLAKRLDANIDMLLEGSSRAIVVEVSEYGTLTDQHVSRA